MPLTADSFVLLILIFIDLSSSSQDLIKVDDLGSELWCLSCPVLLKEKPEDGPAEGTWLYLAGLARLTYLFNESLLLNMASFLAPYLLALLVSIASTRIDKGEVTPISSDYPPSLSSSRFTLTSKSFLFDDIGIDRLCYVWFRLLKTRLTLL